MTEKKKEKPKKPRKGQYDEKLKVNGSFMDIMKAAVKDANKKKQN
jgi:hypothetical protein